jgi:hypothetical protein
MADGRSGGLRKRRAERARSIRRTTRIDPKLRVAGHGEMAQLVIHGALLRGQQQQHETQRFVHASRPVKYL